MSVDLAVPLRAAVIAYAPVVAELPAYEGSVTVFTRRPVPANAPYPLVVVSPDVAPTNVDGINSFRPVLIRDLAVYGANEPATKYRQVERIAYALHALFHRSRSAISVSGWGVTQILARGPFAGPADDEQTVARIVELSIELYRRA